MFAKTIFNQLSEQGNKALEIISKASYSPDSKKKLRTWGITEIASLIDRSPNYIRQQEKEGKIPSPSYRNNKRYYTLQDINFLRAYFNTGKDSFNKPACILSFANFKGGAAKTTTAVNAAQYFALNGYKVLLVDCDSQASSTHMFGYSPDKDLKQEETILPFLVGSINSLSSLIKKTYWDGLDLIPANLALYNAEFIIPTKCAENIHNNTQYNFYEILRKGLLSVSQKYNIIILDCPPSLGMISINAIYASNAIIVPTPTSMLDFTSTIQFFTMLKETFEKLSDKQFDFVKLVVTKHDNRSSSNTILKILRQLYGDYMMLNVISHTEVIRKASASMLTLYEIAKYDGAKKTLERALQNINSLNEEIENEIINFWTRP